MPRMIRIALTGMLAAAVVLMTPQLAFADPHPPVPPATTVPGPAGQSPSGMSATADTPALPAASWAVGRGNGFDACSAPTTTQMSAWLASPYRSVGVYIGGVARACAQPNLTKSWVSTVTGQGWGLLPIYVGLQAPCFAGTKSRMIRHRRRLPSRAAAPATTPRYRMTALGIPAAVPGLLRHGELRPGHPRSCVASVKAFTNAWT